MEWASFLEYDEDVVVSFADDGHIVYVRLGLPQNGGKPRVVITEC
jgi:hypothetical protein